MINLKLRITISIAIVIKNTNTAMPKISDINQLKSVLPSSIFCAMTLLPVGQLKSFSSFELISKSSLLFLLVAKAFNNSLAKSHPPFLFPSHMSSSFFACLLILSDPVSSWIVGLSSPIMLPSSSVSTVKPVSDIMQLSYSLSIMSWIDLYPPTKLPVLIYEALSVSSISIFFPLYVPIQFIPV